LQEPITSWAPVRVPAKEFKVKTKKPFSINGLQKLLGGNEVN